MFKPEVEIKQEDKIKVFCDGILILNESSYNSIISIITQVLEVIQDKYQLILLNEALRQVKERAVV